MTPSSQNTTSLGDESSLFSAYIMPLMVIFGSAAFSLIVAFRVPVDEFASAQRWLVLTLFPLVSFLVFLGTRLLLTRTARQADLILTWLMVFLWVIHGIFLFYSIGALMSVLLVIPAATSLLFLILGLIVAQQPFGSVFGIRTKMALTAAEPWGQIHRRFGVLQTLVSVVGCLLVVFGHPLVAMAWLAFGPFGALWASARAAHGPLGDESTN